MLESSSLLKWALVSSPLECCECGELDKARYVTNTRNECYECNEYYECYECNNNEKNN